jgi:RNA polymerase sigma-70 factor (ECF subfamily)
VDSIHKNVVGIEQIDALYSYAVILTSNDAEAECLVYETYLRTVQGVDGLKGGNSLKSGLLTTLRNLWLNQTQRRRAASQIGIIDGLATDERGAPSKDPPHIRDMEGQRVRHAIQQLSVDLREVIFLREHERLSYLEIADILNCSIETIISRLEDARYRLRALLPKRSQALPPVSVREIHLLPEGMSSSGHSGGAELRVPF